MLSDSKKPHTPDDPILDEDAAKDETDGTFATIYRVNSKSELFVAVENSGDGIKDEFEFRKSESIGNAEGMLFIFYFWFCIDTSLTSITCDGLWQVLSNLFCQ